MPHKMFGVRRTPISRLLAVVVVSYLLSITLKSCCNISFLCFGKKYKRKLRKQKQKEIFAAFILTSHKSQPKFQGPKEEMNTTRENEENRIYIASYTKCYMNICNNKT